ncbi:MAG TPA: hypothetical protein VLK29_09580 [Luteimonas sp.]|nr:hypothetical protein [Luteimonas sp.]
MTFIISLEELALHHCLMQVDGHAAGRGSETELQARLVAGGMAVRDGDALVLTPAGVELCRSLQHKIAAEKEAERVLAEGGGGGEPQAHGAA